MIDLAIIGNYGFPIFMVLWFMMRTEKIINKNTHAIEKLTVMVERIRPQ